MIATVSAAFQTLLTLNLLSNLKNRSLLTHAHGLDLEGVGQQWTLALPVRDEAENLKELLPQIVDQRYRPKSLVFLNDQSSDGTTQIIEQYSAKHDWICQQEGERLGTEWRGKVWALHQLLNKIETPYVVFMDADVRLQDSQSLAALWGYARQLGFLESNKTPGFLSVFPKTEGPVGASLLMDQVPLHLHYFLPFFRRHLKVSGAVAGCGQLMLMRVDELKDLGGFARVRHSTHDGLRLARIYQGAGRNVFSIDGQEKFSVKMYRDFSEAFKGFSRNSYEADVSLPVALGMSAMLFWGFVLPYVLWPFLMLNPFWAASFLFYLYGQHRLAEEMKWPVWSLATTPVRGVASVGVHLWGAFRALKGIETEWKGRVLR
jgi:glycosyltransferase involved in cell wall biosynthesis